MRLFHDYPSGLIGQFLARLLPVCGFAGLFPAAGAADSWDITDTGQPYKDVEFTLSEGTWMSVDVSPDGQLLVFDLLGDLYLMPSAGGAAILLSGGPAIDRTPSFSADGRAVLYLSDRSGEDNVWMIGVDGANARQITHETSKLLANPAWSSNERYVAVSVADTQFESTYASQIRLYHVDGGAGQTLVDIPANKRDVQEPEFSPDGKHVYYTQRIEDTGIYVDANHTNFAIMRRDLRTGDIEQVVGGFGGAVSPQASPDSSQLAFVRRVKDQTVLFVYDLESGREQPVTSELDRDQQADFYPQGVYFPGFGWFPDGKHLAIWGKGKLLKVNIESGSTEQIPFTVESRHRIVTPPRFSHQLAPEEIEVLTASQLAPAPDGKTLLFHALGHLWKKDLPSGRPRRLSSGDAFEFDPTWTTNGRQVAYVEWDDETGSRLTIASASGGQRSAVAESPGIVRQPAFSPDGQLLVYVVAEPQKGMGGYRARPGLYTVPTSGGEPRRVADTGHEPRFSMDGSRIYFSRVDSGDTTLYSINLEGYDERAHAKAVGADRHELRLSPDGNWISFKEEQQYYLMPYLQTGNVLNVSAESDAVPVSQLTSASGYNLVWLPNSTAVLWTLGKDIYRTSVNELSRLDDPSPQSFASIDLTVPGDRPDGAVAFRGGKVITMLGEEVFERGTVVVEGNRISAVGPADAIEIPRGAHVVDTTGKTVMPGLVDMHGHIDCCYYGGPMPQKHASHYAAAAFGVTTNLDQYTSEITAYATSEMQKAGLLVGPRFIPSGRVIYGRAGRADQSYVPLENYQDAVNTMTRKAALGGHFIKSYKQPSRRARQQLVKAGREAGIMVDGEGESQFFVDLSILLDGTWALEHCIPVANYYDDLVQLMTHSGVVNTPTLIITFGEIMGENYFFERTRAWEKPKIKTFVQEVTSHYSPVDTPYAAPLHVRSMASLHAVEDIWDIGFRSVSRSIKKLDDAGVTINVGSHGEVSGLSMHWEMQALSQGGMSNHRILRAATMNGARSLGLEHQIGSLEPGKLADIIVLDEDPLEDIAHSESVLYTMINGRLYDSTTMDEIGNYDRPRSRFYWELPDYHGIDWNEAWSGQ